MSNEQRIFRMALVAAIAGLGYWFQGPIGAFSFWILFMLGYGVILLANSIVRDIRRATQPKIQIDNRTLNMNVETGSAIKGTPVTVVHRDPTRPDRELTR